MCFFCCALFFLFIACDNTQSRPLPDASTNADTAGADIDTGDTAALNDDRTDDMLPESVDEADGDQIFTDEDALSPDEPVYPAGNEAGFVEVAPRIFEDNTCHARSRMFYIFQSADESPEEKPLFVFFNGGPASPTYPLFTINTSKYTADPVFTGGGNPIPNPNSWSTLGNLLYVDARQAGFSYELFTPDCTYNPLPDHIGDAADFIETLLGLFEKHPEIEHNPVVLVGESWGGIRAETMLLMLLYYEQIPYPSTRERLEAHYRRIFPEYDGQTVPVSAILTQFIAQILIQPYYEGTSMSEQDLANDPALQYAMNHQDEDPVHLLPEKLDAGFDALMHLDTMGIILQSDPADIALMYATERTDAFRPTEPSDQQGDLSLLYGTLKPNDSFFSGKGNTGGGDPPNALAVFLELIKLVPTMMTNARWDLYTVFVPGYPAAIRSSHSDRVSEVIVKEEEWIIRYISGEPTEVSVFVPRYLDSNHMVSASEPAKLLNDARRFMEERTAWQPVPPQHLKP